MPGWLTFVHASQSLREEARAMPSSVIAAMHYNPETRVLMIVYRGDRGRYRYFDVTPEEWSGFQAAPSKGSYLNGVFKERGHRYEKVQADSRASAVD